MIVLHPDELDAKKFAESLYPLPDEGGKYEWIYELAKDRFKWHDEAFKLIDDKASSIVTSIGGATGLFTIGSLAALQSFNADWRIVACAIPSVIFAIAAVAFATASRSIKKIPTPPTPVHAVEYVRVLDGNGEPKSAFIGEWHWASEMYGIANHKKANWLNWSFKMFVISISCLLIPMAVGLTMQAIEKNKTHSSDRL